MFCQVPSTKDTSFISPVSIFIGAQQDDNPWLQQGNLVMPLRQLDNNRVVECFIPCGGIDPDTDEIPTWSEEISLKDIVPDLDKKCIHPLRLAGVGKITGYRDFNFAIVQPNQVKKDDYVISRGQWMQVVTSGEDAFNPGRDNVTFKTNLTKNINKQKFEIVRWPHLCGKILQLDVNNLKEYEPVSVSLSKINLDNIGSLNISFINMCFNSLGFLTHDTHVSM